MEGRKIALGDHSVTIFKQPKSNNWFARFYTDRTTRYTTTLKTDDEKEAKARAIDWFIKTRGKIDNGNTPVANNQRRKKSIAVPDTPRAGSFKAAADKALEVYRTDGHAKSYVDGLRRVFNLLAARIGQEDISSVNQATWTRLKANLLKNKPKLSQRTLHQYKVAMQVVLKQAFLRGELKEPVAFVREFNGNKLDTPRVWFNPEEYKKLKDALRANIAKHRKEKSHHLVDAEELHNFCIWLSSTGMRISEAMNVRFCDVSFAKDQQREILEIINIKGKRGNSGTCKSFFGAPYVFRQCIKRHGLTETNYKKSDAKIFKRYHREMFKDLLKEIGLCETNDRPPRRRDLMCMRHTYISFALLRGVPVWDVARNTRTSVAMIQDHYAKHLENLRSTSINKNFNLIED
jgi:integrase